MPTTQRTDARRNRERLLDAAHEAFTEAGADASLNDIARRAGVGPGTLYRHFPTRSALLAAVLHERIERLCAYAGHLTGTRPADEALAEWLRAFIAHNLAYHGLASALFLEAPDTLNANCHEDIRNAGAAVLTHAQRSGTARPDLSAPELLLLALGIALTTARPASRPAPTGTPTPDRLLALLLDTVHPRPHTP
ncbi:TetR/AcrR family transcriptional regulator [Kitasatospora sp. NPDC002965]|uniref:TetR/AcrR family transcriptional regulator n=1 Tax=Kitasatospora sp. NPDC002965 TaxID=3154775 RepID=UPI0033B9DD36